MFHLPNIVLSILCGFRLRDLLPVRSSSLRDKSWLETALKNDGQTSNGLLAAVRIRLSISVYQAVVEAGDRAVTSDEA